MGDRAGGLTSFGIGLTRLRAIAKRVGRDRDLAVKLWKEPNHDAKIIGLLIDDPKQLTRDQVEQQVDGAGPGMLSHVLSSRDATLPKSPIAFEVAKDWMASKGPVRRACGYGLVYELAKDKKDKRTVTRRDRVRSRGDLHQSISDRAPPACRPFVDARCNGSSSSPSSS
jgi:hypothetical protein